MIEVKNLTKKYGSHKAVDDISFVVNDGEILGFLGPNGAGKSTTMNILTGYLSATSGKAVVNGFDVLEHPNQAKKQLGYLPELPPLYLDMTVKEYLNFVYDLKKVSMPRGPHIEEICKLVKIKDVYHRLIKNLSKGYRQRVGIAQALIGNPRVLILDEPTVGLDPKQIIEIRNLVRMLGKTHTVILSSHILSEVQAVCDRVIVINKGRVIADDTPDNLSRNLSDDHSMSVIIDGERKAVESALKNVKGVKSVSYVRPHDKANEFVVEPIMGYDIRRPLFQLVTENNWPILQLKSNELTLEDIFLRLTDETIDTSNLERSLKARKEVSVKAEDIIFETEEKEDAE
ncbi:MAG: ATP-binding cassette domain-containing protein [Clostridia bacterium]|nr:ATP-binding cassette domain-containing protein [Clostridia bacterium]